MSSFTHAQPRSIIAAMLLAACGASCGRKESAPTTPAPDLSKASLPARSEAAVPFTQPAMDHDIDLAHESFISSHPRPSVDPLFAGEPRVIAHQNPSRRNIRVLYNKGYVTGYDESKHSPAWVAYRLHRHGEVGENSVAAPRDLFSFKTDTRTTSRITERFYFRSGYDRGHLAPNDAIGVNYGEEAQRETFLMSNIAPQLPQFNRGVWAYIERIEQNNWANAREDVWVITGPIYTEDESAKIRHQNRAIPVPSSYFKIFLDEEDSRIKILGVVVPHDTKRGAALEQILRSVDEIERASGLDFNPDLPDPLEDSLEGDRPRSVWSIGR
jgi:endonuclease G